MRNLKVVQFIHLIIRSVQLLFLIIDLKYRKEPIDGDAVIRISFFLIITLNVILTISLLQEKFVEHINIFNTFFQIPSTKSNLLIKLMYFNFPIVGILVPSIYALAVIFINLDPITLYLSSAPMHWPWSFLLLGCFKIIMVFLEIYGMTIAANFCMLLFYQGMFCWYIVLYKMIKRLREKIEKISKGTSAVQSCTLKVWLAQYRHLQIHTVPINNCYQEKYALYFKPLLIFSVVVLWTVILDPKLRSSTSTTGIVLSTYCLINVSFLVTLGYYVPGQVNEISKSILTIFKSKVGAGKSESFIWKDCRRTIWACRDIRIYIGESNFYERMTVLNILSFLADETTNLIISF